MAKSVSLDVFKNLMRELKAGELKPVYVLHGSETFFIDRIQDAFEALIPDESKDFNLDLLYAREAGLDQVLSISKSFPMMADKRLVIVREFMRLFETRESGVSENKENSERNAGPDDLIAYINNPNPSNMLLLIDEKLPPATTRLGKALRSSSNAGIYAFDYVAEHQLPSLIVDWIKHNHDLSIEPDAAQLLAMHLGHNLLQVTIEAGKLATYKSGQGAVTKEDVTKIVGISREYNVFELQDAITARDLDKALYVGVQLLRRSESVSGEVIKTAAFLYSTFSNVWQIQRLRAKSWPDKQIRPEIGVRSPYYYNKLAELANRYSLWETEHIFEILLDADKAVKGFSQLDPESIFLMTIRKIVTGENKPVNH